MVRDISSPGDRRKPLAKLLKAQRASSALVPIKQNFFDELFVLLLAVDQLSFLGRGFLHQRICLMQSEACEHVIHISVVGLVRSDNKEQVSHCSVWFHAPVINRYLRCSSITEGRESSIINSIQNICVRLNGFLFKITDESVANLGIDHVREKEEVHEDSLGSQDRPSEDRAGLFDGDKGEQMHPLILSLLQKRVNPAMIARHRPERPEVAEHAPNHSWYSSHSLEKDGTIDNLCFCQLANFVARKHIKHPSCSLHSTICN
mmetsp:Transcript_16146/g.36928  ORF Transcript_16146/g.36928 Transcript_16146/m.36928 type:complete len:261 (+) Transcript_16146:647-1429(+)